jgi:creatinine amidohydrolase
VDVDAHIVGHVAQLVGERTGALVLPTLPYGYSSTWLNYPGTVSLRAETLHEVLLDALASLVGQGFRTIFLLNGHRHNYSVMETVARTAMDRHGPEHEDLLIATGSYWEIARDEINALRRSEFGGMAHACELETSIYLAIDVDAVDMEKAVDERGYPAGDHAFMEWADGPLRLMPWWSSFSRTGVQGDATKATAEKGARLLDAAVEECVGFVRELLDKPLPERREPQEALP